MTISILQATIDDFTAIAQLDRMAWTDNRDGAAIPDGLHVWRSWVEHGLVYVARQQDEIIGAVLAYPTRQGYYFLHKAFMHRDHRNKGIGKKLFEAITTALDQEGVDCALTTSPWNEAAVALYMAFGFTEKILRKDYYKAGEDKYLMIRKSQPLPCIPPLTGSLP